MKLEKSAIGRLLAIALLAAAFVGSRAQADPVIALAGTPAADGPNFTWTYNAYTSSPLQSGDFFTLYDVSGYIAGSVSAPAGFSKFVQLTGVTPSSVNTGQLADSAALLNITYQYNGPTIAVTPGSVLNLGAFSFDSNTGNPVEGSFTAENASTQVVGYVGVPGASAGILAPTGGVLSTQVASAPVAQGPDFLQSLELDNFTDFGFNTGSSVTIYDIAGFYAGSLSSPANWNCTNQLNGSTPAGVTIPDNSSLVNVTCTYTGAPVAGGPGSLGDFTFLTVNSSSVAGLFYTSNVISNATVDPANEAVGTVGAFTGVPEPSTLVPLTLAGLLLVSRARRATLSSSKRCRFP